MKFEYVVTPQTYGKTRMSQDVRQRWLAKSIDLLALRYPALKVGGGHGVGGDTQCEGAARGRGGVLSVRGR